MTHRDVNIAEIGHSDIWTASAGQMSWDNLAYREREGSPPVWELKRQFKNTNSSSKSPSFSAHINEAILSPHYHRLLRKLWKYSFKRHSPHRKNFETKIQLRAKFNYFPLCFLNKTRESHSDRLAVQLSQNSLDFQEIMQSITKSYSGHQLQADTQLTVRIYTCKRCALCRKCTYSILFYLCQIFTHRQHVVVYFQVNQLGMESQSIFLSITHYAQFIILLAVHCLIILRT